jgi:hypothetical protein
MKVFIQHKNKLQHLDDYFTAYFSIGNMLAKLTLPNGTEPKLQIASVNKP